jgi:hypothetical protein
VTITVAKSARRNDRSLGRFNPESRCCASTYTSAGATLRLCLAHPGPSNPARRISSVHGSATRGRGSSVREDLTRINVDRSGSWRAAWLELARSEPRDKGHLRWLSDPAPSHATSKSTRTKQRPIGALVHRSKQQANRCPLPRLAGLHTQVSAACFNARLGMLTSLPSQSVLDRSRPLLARSLPCAHELRRD